MSALRVLIGCETSGVVRRAFAALGHDVWSCDLLPAEDAREVPGFPAYAVTSLGRVLSAQKGRVTALSPTADAKGYACLVLCNGRRKRWSVRLHRLVAMAFIRNPSGHPCVRHLDGNPANNRADNLAWGTYADNEADKIGHGTWETRRTGKLTESDRAQARQMLASGLSQKAVAVRLGVSRPTITRLANGSTWGPSKAAAMAAQWGGWALEQERMAHG